MEVYISIDNLTIAVSKLWTEFEAPPRKATDAGLARKIFIS
jgi:hypothetical protein